MIIDLHCHSNKSDGKQSPQALIDHAQKRQVQLLSITDHDTVQAYESLKVPKGLTLIPGVELSAQYQRLGNHGKPVILPCHIVGLGVNPNQPQWLERLASQSQLRTTRFLAMLDKLAIALPEYDAFWQKKRAQILASTDSSSVLGRPMLAKWLCELGVVSNMAQAFSKWLGHGKKAYSDIAWPDIAEAVQWIHQAGGVAVLAHPLKYQQSRGRLRKLLEAFKACGGDGVEVVCGRQTKTQTQAMMELAAKYDFAISLGSDSHDATISWQQLGVSLSPSMHYLTPIWHKLRLTLPEEVSV